jgi:hypothetical protein
VGMADSVETLGLGETLASVAFLGRIRNEIAEGMAILV